MAENNAFNCISYVIKHVTGLTCVPSMKNMDIIFGGIRPDIKLYYSYTSLQCLYDWDITAITAELVSGKVGVVAGVNEIMR